LQKEIVRTLSASMAPDVRPLPTPWIISGIAGLVAAPLGKAFIGGFDSLTAIFCQAVAGGAVFAPIAHAMIPEAIDEAMLADRPADRGWIPRRPSVSLIPARSFQQDTT
jgi:hypothetical protein